MYESDSGIVAMHAYRNELLVEVALAKGITDLALIENPCVAHKDIVKIAGREGVLQKSEKFVFFFAFSCVDNEEKIAVKHEELFGKTLEIETITRYLRNARVRIISIASKPDELENW